MTIMRGADKPKVSQPTPEEDDFEKYKQESKGTGILMSFDDDKPKKVPKKPNLSSSKKKRQKWKKNNHSVIEPPQTDITAYGNMERQNSIKTREEIIESQRKVRKKLKYFHGLNF